MFCDAGRGTSSGCPQARSQGFAASTSSVTRQAMNAPAVADDHALVDQRVRAQPVLQHRGGDVLAARGDEHLLLAAGDRQEPGVVEHAEVAGVQPAVDQRLGRRVVAPVAAEHVVAGVRISPSSAMRTDTPGSGRPTVPLRIASGVLAVLGALVSVSPQPSSTVMPAPRKKWPSRAPSGAPPETAYVICDTNVAVVAVPQTWRLVRDEVLSAVTVLEGCTGLSMLADRVFGRCVVTSAWRSRADLRDSERRVAGLRDHASLVLGTRPEVREWEIAVLHRRRESPPTAGTRATWLQAAPGQVDRVVDAFRLAALPQVDDLPGFCSTSLLVDRTTGRCAAAVTFRDRAGLAASRRPAAELRDLRRETVLVTEGDRGDRHHVRGRGPDVGAGHQSAGQRGGIQIADLVEQRPGPARQQARGL